MAEERRDSAASRKSARRRSSAGSILSKAKKSFYRTGGNKGASVETLRGTSGADFEGKAKIQRGQLPGVGCCCFGGDGNGEPKKERFILIKGHFLFVFSDEEAQSPKYAVDLTHRRTEIEEGSHRPHGATTTVLLETSLGDIDYKIIFDTTQDKEIARKFARVVAEQSATAEAELARKRLGHEGLMNRNKSVKYAEDIGAKKVDAQPDAPITAAEIMDASPVHVDAY